MASFIKKISKRIQSEQRGQILIMTLVLLVLGGLILVSLLSYMGTGAKTGQVYEKRTDELYAADSGIEDAKWKIEYNKLPTDHFLPPSSTNYSPYNFVNLNDSSTYAYRITDQPGSGNEVGQTINNNPVSVKIGNAWIPPESIISKPGVFDAKAIIDLNKLVVSGSTLQTGITADDGTTKISQYKIKIVYDRGSEAADALKVDKIGAWLPRGFEYYSDTNHHSNLEDLAPPYRATTSTMESAGNIAAVWSLSSLPAFSTFPVPPFIADTPMVLEVTFYYKPLGHPDDKPDAVAWVKTDGVADIPYSWDADIKVFHIESTAGSTAVEAYIVKNEMRAMSSSVSGDYYATGNTLMRDAVSDPGHIRDTWLNAIDHSSSATIPLKVNPSDTGVPGDGDVALAYLYWAGWFNEASKNAVFSDDGSNISTRWNKTGTAWTSPGGYFQGHYSGGVSRDLPLKKPLNLSSYVGAKVTLSWKQWLSPAGTQNQTNLPTSDGDINATWNPNPSNPSTCWDKVDETTPNDADYMTGTGGSGNRIRYPTGDNSSSGTWAVYPASPTAKWDKVDETPNDADTTYLTLGTTSGYALFNFSPFSVPAGATISNLTIGYVAKDNNSGSSNKLRAAIRVNGTNYLTADSGADPASNYALRTYSFATNPKTGASWTIADINGTGANNLEAFGINSDDANPPIRITQVYAQVTIISGYKLFNFSPFSIPAGANITDLTVYVRAKDASTGTNDIRPSIKVGGIYYHTTAPGNNPGTSFVTYSYPYTTNPKTGLAWTAQDINGTGPNPLQQFGTYSSNLSSDVQVSMVYARVNYTPAYSSSDGLDFALYDGAAWSTNLKAFRYGDPGIGMAPPASNNFAYTLPQDYLQNGFKIRLSLVGCSDSGKYADVDDISITAMAPDKSVTFKIDGQQVYFDAGNNPQEGSQPIIADRFEVITNVISGNPKGFSYSSFKDVTALVRKYTQKSPDPATNYPGNGTYTLGNVDATLGINGNDDNGDQLAHAGWSLIIIYTSPATLGHQLYLYDRFSFADDEFLSDGVTYSQNAGDLDFDQDNQPGGDISGFIVPPQIPGEVTAASMTLFVGEGDEWIPDDWVAFNAPAQYWDTDFTHYPPSAIPDSYKLWDGISTTSNSSSHPNNVWNGKSPIFAADGIDVDTFNVTWASGSLQPGNTKAHIDLFTHTDNWNLVYIILSFRSQTTTGGVLSYLIHG